MLLLVATPEKKLLPWLVFFTSFPLSTTTSTQTLITFRPHRSPSLQITKLVSLLPRASTKRVFGVQARAAGPAN
jgi:hypothetical protein